MARILDQLHNFHDLLAQAGIDAAIIGGLALGAYNVKRFTNDLDFLIDGSHRVWLKQLMFTHGFTLFAETNEVAQFALIEKNDTLDWVTIEKFAYMFDQWAN